MAGIRFLKNQSINGTLSITTISNANLDTDRFIVADSSGRILFRTGAEVRSDIGAGTSSTIGTVTSIGISAGGDALQITNSPITTNGSIGINWQGDVSDYINGEGDITSFPSIPTVNNSTISITTATGLDGAATFGLNQNFNETISLALDLSELPDMTQDMEKLDEFIILDSSVQKRKRIDEIGVGFFINDAGYTTNTGTMSSFTVEADINTATTTISNGETLKILGGTGIDTFSDPDGTITLKNTSPNIVQSSITGNAGSATELQTTRNISGTAFNGTANITLNNSNITNGAGYTTNTGTTTASNTQTFTNKSGNISQWTNDSGYLTSAGDINGVTAGAGLSGGGTSGTVTLAVDYLGTDSIIKAAPTLSASVATTDLILIGSPTTGNVFETTVSGLPFTNSAGDITNVTAGSGLTGGGTSGSVTVAVDYAGSDSLVMEAGDATPDADDFIIFGSDSSDDGSTKKIQFTDVNLSLFNKDITTITSAQASAITANTAKTGITSGQASAITANTAKVGITSGQASAITANTAKVGITSAQKDAIVANTAKTGITSAQASAITANTAKTGITSTQASNITTNNAKVGITSTQASNITTNNAKVGITSTQASNITTNNAKTGITSTQASNITTNNAKTGITSGQASAITTNTSKVSDTGLPAILNSSGAPTLTSGVTAAEVRTLIGAGTGGGSMSSFNLRGDSGSTVAISQGLMVDIAGGTNISTAMVASGTTRTLTITNGINNNNQLSNGAGYGTSNLAIGTTSTTAMAGNTTTISSGQASAITANTAKTGITSGQASAITANTAKTGITSGQASAITANTAKTGITSGQASAITANTAKVGITSGQASAITANTAKTGITSTQASNITTNNAKVGITSSQAAKIVTNSAKVSDTGIPAILSNGSSPTLNSGISAAEVRTLIGAGTSSSAGVTSVATSGTVSGLTLTGGTITGTGTVTLGGALSLTSANVTSGLGFTPYNATNPSGFTTNTGTTTPSNTQTFTNKSGNISQWTNDSGYVTSEGSNNFVTGGNVTSGTLTLNRSGLSNVSFTINNVQITNGAGYTTNIGTTTPSNTQTFTNKSGNISQWSNNSGYTTNTGTTTASNSQTFTNKGGNISQWTNDSGYVTSSGGSMSSWNLTADGGGSETITNTETVDIAGGTNITTARSGSTVTINNSITNNNQLSNGAGYVTSSGGSMSTWNLTADSGGTESISNNETVTIQGGFDITTSRNGNTITITNGITNNNQLLNGKGYTTNTGTLTGGGAANQLAQWNALTGLINTKITESSGFYNFNNYTSTSTQSGASSLSPIQNAQAATQDSVAQLAVDPSGNLVRSTQEATWTFTTAQLNALSGTRVTILSAPGSGKCLCVEESNWLIESDSSASGTFTSDITCEIAGATVFSVATRVTKERLTTLAGSIFNGLAIYTRDVPETDKQLQFNQPMTIRIPGGTNQFPAKLLGVKLKIRYRVFDKNTF